MIKKRIGRPAIEKKEKAKQLTFCLYEKEIEILKRYSKNIKIPMSRCIGMMINKYMDDME